MNEGYEKYKNVIDEMVVLSRSVVEAANIIKGSFPQAEMHREMNSLLNKLSLKKREKFSQSK